MVEELLDGSIDVPRDRERKTDRRNGDAALDVGDRLPRRADRVGELLLTQPGDRACTPEGGEAT